MALSVDDKLPQMSRRIGGVLDDALKELGRDILVKSRTVAPFDKGHLRADSDLKKVKGVWRITYYKEYARFQEFGGDANRTVRNYSTPGTGKHYLGKTGDEIYTRAIFTLKKHAGRVV